MIYCLTVLSEGCDVASQFETEIKMCLRAYSAVYYDDKDYLENWVQPATNGMILDYNRQNRKYNDKLKRMLILVRETFFLNLQGFAWEFYPN